ncbi:hypothetical protein VB152_12040 [Xanthomonas fragariae]|nr:hypothetical protein [Xanthomonas fragariae]
MTENCQKPAFSVANTGSSGTPVQTSMPCGRWVVGVFQGRLCNEMCCMRDRIGSHRRAFGSGVSRTRLLHCRESRMTGIPRAPN